MRWCEINSEEFDPIAAALLEYRGKLAAQVQSARDARLPRQYEMIKAQLANIDRCLAIVGDINRRMD